MNLQRINRLLTDGMIGTFIPVIPLSLLTLLSPFFGYIVVLLMFILAMLIAVNIVVTTIALVIQINEMIDKAVETYDSHQTERELL